MLILLRLALALYAALVAYISLAPSSGGGLPLWDKAMHFTVYALFALLGSAVTTGQRQLLLTAVIIMFYGALLEVLQHQVGRDMSALDALANSLGVAVALALVWKKRPKLY